MYRLLPRTRGRWRRLERLLEAQRQLYNAALEERIDCWRKAGQSVSWQDLFRSLTVCRREIPEMAADPVAMQRGTPDQVRGRLLKRLDEAYRAFFRRVKAGEAPGFRGRRRWNRLSVVAGVRLEADPRSRRRARLRVPGFGWMAVSRRGGNPYPEGAPVGAVLKREAGKWNATVCLKVSLPDLEDDGTAVGVDMNAGEVAVSGRGRSGAVARLFHAPDTARLPAPGAALLRLARMRRRLAGKRHDWRHRTSRAVAGMAHTVIVEELRVRNMTASARGTAEEPGSRVRQKAGLNRVVLDTGGTELRSMLEYKAGLVVAVDPRNTSRTCHACGHTDAGSRSTRDPFECTGGACPGPRAGGHADHADLNAAANILALGTGAAARGGGGVARPVNREYAWKEAA